MDDEYKSYLKSKEWLAVRESLFLVRGKKCERCRSVDNIQVHHIHYVNIFREQLEDLMVVCKDCHRKIHGLNSSGHKPKKSKRPKKKKLTSREKKKIRILKEIDADRKYLGRTYH